MESWFCDVCHVQTFDTKARDCHLNGKKHQLALHNMQLLERKEKCGVFITGLPNLITKEKLQKFLSSYGAIKDIHLHDKNRFAIVEFRDLQSAQNLLAEPSVYCMGRRLILKQRIVNDNMKVNKEMECKAEYNIELINDLLKSVPNFEQQIHTLINYLQPNQEELENKYRDLCYDLHSCLQSGFPGCKVFPFGSSVTKLNYSNSDVDIYVEVEDGNVSSSQYVKKARNVLLKSHLFANVFAIVKAKTPIVKCVHVPTKVNCDISFKNLLGICNTFLIKYYCNLNNKILQTALIIKYWGKAHDITGINGKFSNYSLTMMLIFQLQQSPYYLPSVAELQKDPKFQNMQDGWNGGFQPMEFVNIYFERWTVREMLHDFFNYYANFNYNFNIISPYIGKIIPKTEFLVRAVRLPDVFANYKENRAKDAPALKVDTLVCVQDPFEHNYNVTKSVTGKICEEFVSLCKSSAKILSANKDSPTKGDLFNIFVDESVEKYRCSESNCEFQLRMGNNLLYFEKKLSPNVTNKDDELRKVWYDCVTEFVITLMTKVLRLNLSVVKEKNAAKFQKLEGQTSVHDDDCVDKVTFRCQGKHNLWEARKAVSRDVDLSSEKTILDKQIFLTNYICEVLCRGIQLSEVIVDFELLMQARQNPVVHIDFSLTKKFARKGCFKTLCVFLSKFLVQWYVTYEMELAQSPAQTNLPSTSEH